MRFSFRTLELFSLLVRELRGLPYTSSDSVNRPYFGPARLLARHNWYEIALKSVGAAIGVRDVGDDADDSAYGFRVCK